MTTYDIRAATMEDLDGLLASQSALFAADAAVRDVLRNPEWPRTHGRSWCAHQIDDPDALALIAVAGDGVVGHLIGSFAGPSEMWRESRAELVSMGVLAAERGAGLGGRLVAAFATWAGERGAGRLTVSAYATNEGALRFYRRQGFTPHSVDLVRDVPPAERSDGDLAPAISASDRGVSE